MAESPDTPDLGWIKPLDAVAVCQRLFGLSEPASRRRLIFLARNDRILRTFCTHFQRRSFDGYENDDEYEDDTLLPGFWTGFDSSQWPSEDWQNGLFSFKTMDREDIAHGVRFSRLDLINYKRKLDGDARELRCARRFAGDQRCKRPQSPHRLSAINTGLTHLTRG